MIPALALAMSLAPLLNASPAIQLHAFTAMGAFALAAVQLLAPKGTIPHRTFGWLWVILMMTVAISSMFIHTIRSFGPFSAIHLLSVGAMVTTPLAAYSARRHDVRRHKKRMIFLFVFALVVAGYFTFIPGRIMHAVLFGL
jgi:uncharacterized membrane protein